MTVNWYNVGNKAEFEAKGIPQEVFTKELEDLGQQEIVFLKGFSFSVIFQNTLTIMKLLLLPIIGMLK